MADKIVRVPKAVNEPIFEYKPGSQEKADLLSILNKMKSEVVEIPVIIGGKEIFTGETSTNVMPHNHKHVLAKYHMAGSKEIALAIETSQEAWKTWSVMPWESRVAIFKKMAVLLAGPYRHILNAATMLGQSKNAFQAEIDAACELIDFFNFNAEYLQEIYAQQPGISPDGMWNQVEHRSLEGFVFAVTPFNFTSIAGNLPTAPALMGNVALWKPASSAVYSGYFLMKMFEEAGLPDGVINFIPGKGSVVGPQVIESEHLAGIHFTGSTAVFQSMWKTIGNNIAKYKTYPRIVGETGGKDFIVAHESTEMEVLRTAVIRGAFEYQGQKCSAASRVYIPRSMWADFKESYISEVTKIKVGDVEDFGNFMNAVIDRGAFSDITAYIDYASSHKDAEIITGGTYDDSVGFFIEPTTIVTTDPHFKTMEEEIFGPVVTIYVYDESWGDILDIVDGTSPYALTGAVLAKDRDAVELALEKLRHSAGNFYINDKPTGAVVGQQPFGGSRASGTNDKAGSIFNLIRWISQRTIKENFLPPTEFPYPFMEKE
ncbi:MAG: L-glutamate gamma-semialdehyde dehydrogenase [FCB group bacterium]|nr:L-glutamate gamma-semialdehyde dehydrogenase [FCB group bacterium]MBL7027664.1 L-glutamate gamma-semialdehyde dehydrogenase [Candidatus Neomarinimicrobiota bacterium]MBL7121089.1 L-glutamate gamma-semialdehyde dehydrogenase [Candidatus Neomarinimicrobiota bacterium]